MASEFDDLDAFLGSAPQSSKPAGGNEFGDLDAFLGSAPPSAAPQDEFADLDGFLAQPPAAKPSSGIMRRAVADPLVGFARGVPGVAQAAIGLADLTSYPIQAVLHGRQKALRPVYDKILPESLRGLPERISAPGMFGRGAAAIGADFAATDEAISTLLSPETREAERRYQEAEGFMGKVKAAVANPSSIIQGTAQSIPLMLAGGAIGKAAFAGSKASAALAKTARYLPGAVGEGVVAAGSFMEGARSATPDGVATPKIAALAATTGLFTGLITAAGGKLADMGGWGDVNTMLAGGGGPDVKRAAALNILYSAFQEGVFEEGSQSAFEGIAQNVALDRPWYEGLDGNLVQGIFSGMMLGGGANAYNSIVQRVAQSRGPGDPSADDLARQANEAADAMQADEDADIRSELAAERVAEQGEPQLMRKAPVVESPAPIGPDPIPLGGQPEAVINQPPPAIPIEPAPISPEPPAPDLPGERVSPAPVAAEVPIEADPPPPQEQLDEFGYTATEHDGVGESKYVERKRKDGTIARWYRQSRDGHRVGDLWDMGDRANVVGEENDTGDTAPLGNVTDVAYYKELHGPNGVLIGRRRATQQELEAKRQRLERDQSEHGADIVDPGEAAALGFTRQGDKWVRTPAPEPQGIPLGKDTIDPTLLQQNLDAGMPMAEAREKARSKGIGADVRAEPPRASPPVAPAPPAAPPAPVEAPAPIEAPPAAKTPPAVNPEAVSPAMLLNAYLADPAMDLTPYPLKTLKGAVYRAQGETKVKLATAMREALDRKQAAPVVEEVAVEPAPPPAVKPEVTSPEFIAEAEKTGDTINEFPLESVTADPERFQYKVDPAASGATGSLSGVKVYNKRKGGTLSLWRDPADGKIYVINGHNRLAKAKELGVVSHKVTFLDAKTDAEARAQGAAENIADGKGTPIDAAKFFRDSGMTMEEMEADGMPMNNDIVKKGRSLARLSQPVFDKVIDGSLSENIGVVIGASGLTPAQQLAVANMAIERDMSPTSVGTLIEEARTAPDVTKDDDDGGWIIKLDPIEKNLLANRVRVIDAVNRRLSGDKKLFGMVSRSGAAGRLGKVGNVLNVDANKKVSQDAAVIKEVFNKLRKTGAISTALNEAAKEIDDGKPYQEVLDRTYERVRAAVSEAIGGGKGESAPPPAPAPQAEAGGGEGVAPSRLDAIEASALRTLDSLGGRATMGADVDRVMALAQLAAVKIARTGIDFATWSIEFAKEFADLTKDQLADIWGKAQTIVVRNFQSDIPGLEPEAPPSDRPITSINKDATDAEYAAKGYPDFSDSTVEHRDAVIARAKDRMRVDPTLADRTIKDMTEKPRAFTGTDEQAIVLLGKAEREANLRKASAELDAAEKAGDPARLKEAQIRWTFADKEDRAVAKLLATGDTSARTIAGRMLAFFNTKVDDSFDIVRIRRVVQEAQGWDPLSKEQEANMKDIAALGAKADAALDTEEAFEALKAAYTSLESEVQRVRDENAQKDEAFEVQESVIKEQANELFKREAAKVKVVSVSADRVARAKIMREEALADLKLILSPTRVSMSVTVVSPELIPAVIKYGAGFVLEGAARFDMWRAKMRGVFGSKLESQNWKDLFDQSVAAAGGEIAADTESDLQNDVQTAKDALALPDEPVVEGAKPKPDPLAVLVKRRMNAQIKAGVRVIETAAANVVDQLKSNFPAMTEAEVYRLYSDYGKASFPSGDIDMKTRAQFRSQGRNLTHLKRLMRKLELLQAGMPSDTPDATTERTGQQRDKPDVRTREIERQVKKALKDVADEARRQGVKLETRPEQIAGAMELRKTALRNQIIDIDESIKLNKRRVTNKDTLADDPETAALRELRNKKQAQYDEMFPQLPLTPEQQLKVALRQSAKTLADWQQRLREVQSGKLKRDKKVAPDLPPSMELDGIKAQVAAVKAEVKRLLDLANPKLTPEQLAVKNQIARNERAAATYDKRTAAGDFDPRPVPHIDISGNPRALAALEMKGEAQARFMDAKRKANWKKMGITDRTYAIAGTVWDTSRDVLSSGELSATLRQGFFSLFINPHAWVKANKSSLVSLSRTGSMKRIALLEERTNFRNGYYKTGKLALAQHDGRGNYTGKLDDRIKADIVSHIPLLGASNRAYGAFLNQIRAELFDYFLSQHSEAGKPSDKLLKEIGERVNILTGKGQLGIAQALQHVIYAPSFIKAQIDLITAKPMRSADPEVRWMMAKSYAKILTGVSVLASLAALLGGGDDPIEWNPASSSFLMVKVGNYRVGLLGYIRAPLVFFARQLMGYSKISNKKSVRLRRDPLFFAPDNISDTVDWGGTDQVEWRALKSKLHPAFGGLKAISSGIDFNGNVINRAKAVLKAFTPITWGEVYETSKIEEDVESVVFISILMALGLDVRPDYSNPKVKRKLEQIRKSK